MRRTVLVGLLAASLGGPAVAENYLLNGGQESKIHYRLYQKVEPAAGTKSRKVTVSLDCWNGAW